VRTLSSRVTTLLVTALAGLVAFALTAVLALAVPVAHRFDAALLHGFMSFKTEPVSEPADFLANSANPKKYILAGLCLCAVAVARRRWWRAGAVATLFVVCGVSTQVAQRVLATHRYDAFLENHGGQMSSSGFPSGHAAAAMTIALCAVLVAPAAWRTLAVVAGWAYAAGVGYAIVVHSWHYPSDVLGGYLLAGILTALALALLRAVEDAPASVRPWWPARGLALGVLAGAALSALIVTVGHQTEFPMFPVDRWTLAIGAMVIAAVAGALSAALARAA
jgi:membrane-associated phospholipid phosphatase